MSARSGDNYMASDELEKKEEMQQTTESLSSDNPEKEPERELVKESEKETDRLTPESVEQSKKSLILIKIFAIASTVIGLANIAVLMLYILGFIY